MNRVIALFFFCQFSFVAIFASSNCFKDHLKEALHINNERRPLYSKLSSGESDLVSSSLIFSEKLLLFFGKWGFFDFDLQFEDELKYGLQITCDTFVKMDKVPTFKEFYENGPPSRTTPLVSLFDLGKQIYFALKDKNLKNTHELLILKIDELSAEPRLNCMSRHILESMARVTSLYPDWVKKIQTKKDQEQFSDKIINVLKSHLYSFPQALFMDSEARNINLKGIPLICQDVPAIPLIKDAYQNN